MKIAISTDGDVVSSHFGRCPSFTIVELSDGKIIQKEVLDNPGHHPGFLPEFLQGKGVVQIIAGGMGQRALILFEEKGITPVLGVSGKIEDVLEQISAGSLKGGESSCQPGGGRGYGLDKTECDNPDETECDHEEDEK